MKTTEEVVRGLVKHARPEILKEFRADSCIATTAIGLDILTEFGVLAEPFPVRLLIFNEAFANRIEKGTPWPSNKELIQWSEEDGSYSVGIGVGTQQPGKWAGHLVILIEKRYLLDLSIDQANRPKYNMNFDPVCVEVDEKFFKGAPRVIQSNGSVIRIEALRNDGYSTSPDWIFSSRRKKLVENILRLIKGDFS